MLVLTRYPEETLVIGDDIYITALEVNGNQVRIGIEAPKELSVHRLESVRIQSEKRAELSD